MTGPIIILGPVSQSSIGLKEETRQTVVAGKLVEMKRSKRSMGS